jgi:hypothetical protein
MRIRAAASSIARGSPSSFAHSSATESLLLSSIPNDGATSRVLEKPHRVGAGQRGHRPGPLALHGERLPAGGKHGQGRALGKQVLGQLGDGGGQVLAVVEHDEHRPVGVVRADVEGDRRGRVQARCLGHAQPPGHGQRDDIRDIHRRQLNPGHVGVGGQRGRGGQRQPRLAGATRPGQRQQAAASQRAPYRAEFGITAHERR